MWKSTLIFKLVSFPHHSNATHKWLHPHSYPIQSNPSSRTGFHINLSYLAFQYCHITSRNQNHVQIHQSFSNLHVTHSEPSTQPSMDPDQGLNRQPLNPEAVLFQMSYRISCKAFSHLCNVPGPKTKANRHRLEPEKPRTKDQGTNHYTAGGQELLVFIGLLS